MLTRPYLSLATNNCQLATTLPLEPRTLLSAVTFNGTSGNDTITIDYNSGTAKVTAQLNSNTAVSYDAFAVDAFTIAAGDGNDTIVLNRSHGNLFFSGTLIVDGGAGTDSLELAGPGATTITSAGYAPTDEGEGYVTLGHRTYSFEGVEGASAEDFSAVTVYPADDEADVDLSESSGDAVVEMDGYSTLTVADTGTVIIDASADGEEDADDTFTVDTFPDDITLRILAGFGDNAINVTDGEFTLDTTSPDYFLDGQYLSLSITNSAIVHLAPNQYLHDLILDDDATADLPEGLFSALFLDQLSIALDGNDDPTATLDLNDNDLVIHDADLDEIEALVYAGFHVAAWDGKGITSSVLEALADDNSGQYLGAVLGLTLNAGLRETFDGNAVAEEDLLIKFVLNGDSDLTGVVDIDDYFFIDANYNTLAYHWYEGNYNYTGEIDADDLFLIDWNFYTQYPRPEISASGVIAVDEGDEYTLKLAFEMDFHTECEVWQEEDPWEFIRMDPCTLEDYFDPLSSFTIDWGDAHVEHVDVPARENLSIDEDTGVATFQTTHVYTDDFAFDAPQIRAFAKGSFANTYVHKYYDTTNQIEHPLDDPIEVDALLVSVLDVAPTVSAELDVEDEVDEGDEVTLTLTSSDPGDDEVSDWQIDWGDGTTDAVIGDNTQITHTYIGPAETYTILTRAYNDDGSFDPDEIEIDVLNLPPIVTIDGDETIDEGEPFTLELSAVDAGDDPIASWTIDWDDDTALETIYGNPDEVTHIYQHDDESVTIEATAEDADGDESESDSIEIEVVNVDPTITLDGADSIDAGSYYVLHFRADGIYQGDLDWEIDWGDGTEPEAPNYIDRAYHLYVPESDGTLYIDVTATDSEDNEYSPAEALALDVTNTDWQEFAYSVQSNQTPGNPDTPNEEFAAGVSSQWYGFNPDAYPAALLSESASPSVVLSGLGQHNELSVGMASYFPHPHPNDSNDTTDTLWFEVTDADVPDPAACYALTQAGGDDNWETPGCGQYVAHADSQTTLEYSTGLDLDEDSPFNEAWFPWKANVDLIRPTISISFDDTATENPTDNNGDDEAGFTITREGDHLLDDLTVYYRISGFSTATPGDDYEELSGSAVIPAEEATVFVPFVPTDDEDAEWTENVYIECTDEDEVYQCGQFSNAKFEIVDDDWDIGFTDDILIGNSDDDNENGIPDYYDRGTVTDEDDLYEMELMVPTDDPYQGALITISCAEEDIVRVWDSEAKSVEYIGPEAGSSHTWPVLQAPHSVWVEIIGGSASIGSLIWILAPDTAPASRPATRPSPPSNASKPTTALNAKLLKDEKDKAPNGRPWKVLVGERINLSVTIEGPCANPTYDWQTPPGVVFKDYDPSNTNSNFVPLPEDHTDAFYHGQTFFFYWADGGNNRQPDVNVVCPEIGFHVTITFDVIVPDSTAKASYGEAKRGKIDGMDVIGLLSKTGARPGAKFVASVSVPQPFAPGSWNFVQLWNRRFNTTFINAFNGNVKFITPHYGDYGNDNFWPMLEQPGVDPYTVENQKAWPTNSGDHARTDTPRTPLDARAKYMRYDNDFKTYVMFKPAGETSKWVPLLAAKDWHFEITASRADANTDWSVDNADTDGKSFSITSSHPKWTFAHTNAVNMIPDPNP